MNVFEVIKKRRSIRAYNSQKKLTKEQIDKLLEAASWAPSAGNLQSYFIFVVENQKVKDEISKAAFNQEFIKEAPVVFVICGDLKKSASCYGFRGETLYSIQDATLATYNLWLAATEMELAGCWVGAFDEREVSQILNIPKDLRPIVLLPIGYSQESPFPPKRKKIEKMVKRID